MDVEMPGGDGITATGAIRAEKPDIAVLILTTFDLDDYVIGPTSGGFRVPPKKPRRLAN